PRGGCAQGARARDRTPRRVAVGRCHGAARAGRCARPRRPAGVRRFRRYGPGLAHRAARARLRRAGSPCTGGGGMGEAQRRRAGGRGVQSRPETDGFRRLRASRRSGALIAAYFTLRAHMASKPYYITTAIPYANGPPHIGHAYEAIATDAIARFMRLDGYDVLFLTGTDDHGIKTLHAAAEEEPTPQQLVERNVPLVKKMVERLNCSNG